MKTAAERAERVAIQATWSRVRGSIRIDGGSSVQNAWSWNHAVEIAYGYANHHDVNVCLSSDDALPRLIRPAIPN